MPGSAGEIGQRLRLVNTDSLDRERRQRPVRVTRRPGEGEPEVCWNALFREPVFGYNAPGIQKMLPS